MGRENCTTGLSPVGKPYNRPGGRGNAPLLVADATTFPPAGGLYSSLSVELTKRGFAVFYSVPRMGESPAQPDRGANAASQSAECFSCHMTLKVNPVTLTSYSSPCGRYHNPRPEGPSNLRTLRPIGPVNPKNLSLHNPSTQPAADRRPQPSGWKPVNPHAEGVFNGVSGRVK